MRGGEETVYRLTRGGVIEIHNIYSCMFILVLSSMDKTSLAYSSNPLLGGEERKLFIGGLSWETKEPQLLEYFSQ